MSLTSDTRVVILGGTSGIGLAVAHAAAARGAQIVVGSSRQSTVDTALASLPAGVTGLTVDAGSSESLAAFLDAAGVIDHFVYTAGENRVPRRSRLDGRRRNRGSRHVVEPLTSD